jgi:hypothetical protein
VGKHETGFERVPKDRYPTPHWVIGALAEHLDLNGLTVWECACGKGDMAEALRLAGCARVYCSDIDDCGCNQDETLDFLSWQEPKLERPPDLIITNPPFGPHGTLVNAFIESGLTRIRRHGGILALLLPTDCDSAKGRARYFADCPDFIARIVLRRRIVWFTRTDGKREGPKENHAWFLWRHSPLRIRYPPATLYAPVNNEPRSKPLK